jgi:hypothetical protein
MEGEAHVLEALAATKAAEERSAGAPVLLQKVEAAELRARAAEGDLLHAAARIRALEGAERALAQKAAKHKV